MKKALLLTAIAIVSLISLPLLALFVLLNTSYASQVVNVMLQNLTPYTITAQQASYSPPFQLTLEDVEINAEPKAILIPKLTVWLSPTLWQNNQASFDSVLIEDANLDINELRSIACLELQGLLSKSHQGKQPELSVDNRRLNERNDHYLLTLGY